MRKSLIQTSLVPKSLADLKAGFKIRERTIGVTFRPEALLIPSLENLNCPGLNTEAIIPKEAPTCTGISGYSADVVLRSKLGVIREEDL